MSKSKLIFIILIITLFSCEKESIIEYTIDTPIDFKVSKGIFVDKIKLEWNNPPKAKQIEIFRYDSLLDSYKSIGFSTSNYFFDTINFIPNEHYFYKIRAFNSSKEISDFTNYNYGYVLRFNSPTITNIGYGVSDTEIKIEWNSVLGADNYSIFRSDNNSLFIELKSTEALNWSDLNLISGKTYYYKIQANNSKLGSSDYSQPDSGYVLEKYTYFTSFGTFNNAFGIEFDDNNNIYVSDNPTGVIKIYNSDYSFKKDLIDTDKYLRGLTWSLEGNLIALDSEGNILHIDNQGNIIESYSVPNTNLLHEIDIDTEGNIYITDISSIKNEILKLNSNGDLLLKWKMEQVNSENYIYVKGLEYNDNFNNVIVGGKNGNKFIEIFNTEGEFIKNWDFPYQVEYISQDISGNLYIACGNRMIKTDMNGKILAYFDGDFSTVKVNGLGDVFSCSYKGTKVNVYKKISK
jgi:hypothetical protein